MRSSHCFWPTAAWTKTVNSIEQYIHLLIDELRQKLEHLPTRYPDTYGKTFAHWHSTPECHQEEDFDR